MCVRVCVRACVCVCPVLSYSVVNCVHKCMAAKVWQRRVMMSFLLLPPVLSDVVEGLVSMCVEIHQSVARKSLQYKAELSRHNYVTPTRCVRACLRVCVLL